jgi:hypothetical protein
MFLPMLGLNVKLLMMRIWILSLKIFELKVNIETLSYFFLSSTNIDFPAVEKILGKFYIGETKKIAQNN